MSFTDEDLGRLKEAIVSDEAESDNDKWPKTIVRQIHLQALIARLEAAETPCGMAISRLVCKCSPCLAWRKAAGK